MLKLVKAARYLPVTPGVTGNNIIRCIANSTISQFTNHSTGSNNLQTLPLINNYQEKHFQYVISKSSHSDKLKNEDQLLSRLSISPVELQASLALVLPSRDLSNPLPNAIVEPVPKPVFDCPHSENLNHILDPLLEGSMLVPSFQKVEKKAKNRITNEIHRRRRKMNHHRYKKWRKRMKFKLRQIKQKRRKAKQKKWEQYIEGLKFKGLTKEAGEAHLKDKEERLKIFLRYLGFEGDAVKSDKPFKPRGIQYVHRPRKITRRMDEKKSGEIVPTPLYKKVNSS